MVNIEATLNQVYKHEYILVRTLLTNHAFVQLQTSHSWYTSIPYLSSPIPQIQIQAS